MSFDKPSKTWKFVVNNWTPEELDNILHWDVNRMAVAEEVGAEGTPHLQGHVTFSRAMRLTALKKIQSRAHWEPALVADWNYEHKDGQKVHRIDNRRPGARTDLLPAQEAVQQAVPLTEFAFRPGVTLSQVKHYQLLRSLTPGRVATDPLEILWYWGPTGSGKTRAAWEQWPDLYIPLSFKWWDGYEGQETILIDDFRRDWCKFHELLVLLDVYPQTREVKGARVRLNHRRIVITSPHHPQTTYETREDTLQLIRRITTIRHFTADRETGLPEAGPRPLEAAEMENNQARGGAGGLTPRAYTYDPRDDVEW